VQRQSEIARIVQVDRSTMLLLVKNNRGEWKHETDTRTINGINYTLEKYRPRTEGLFARIEKWTQDNDGDIHWR
jgi:hypothetical protein